MCGRYAIYGPHSSRRVSPADASLLDRFVEELAELTRYNIAPTAEVPVIGARGGEPRLEVMRWGLKKDGKPFNVRADSASKPWARSLLKSRVIFPASGFYEWQAIASAPKQPWFFVDPAGRYLAIAGAVGHWEGLGATMFTTEANDMMEPIHHRMPVVLDEAGVEAWLDPATPPERVLELLRPAPEDALERYRVGRAVGNSRNEGPSLIEPAPNSA